MMASGAQLHTKGSVLKDSLSAVSSDPKGAFRQRAAVISSHVRHRGAIPDSAYKQALLTKRQARILSATGSPHSKIMHDEPFALRSCALQKVSEKKLRCFVGREPSSPTKEPLGKNRLSVNKRRGHEGAFAKTSEERGKPCRVVKEGRVAEGAADRSRDYKELASKDEDLRLLQSTGAANLALRLRERFNIDDLWWEILVVSFPALLALAADPIASLYETSLVGKLGPAQLAAAGLSINVFNTLCKLFNFPLLNVTTSFVAEAETQRQRSQETDSDRLGLSSKDGHSSRRFSSPPEEDLLSDHSYLNEECGACGREEPHSVSNAECLEERRKSSNSTSTSASESADGFVRTVRTGSGPRTENGASSNGEHRKAPSITRKSPLESQTNQLPVNEAVSASIAVGAALGFIESLILGFGASQILGLYGANSEMMGSASMYLALRAIGAPALVVSLAVSGAFRGFGDTKTPLYAQVAGNVLNVALLPLFMFSLGWGIAGAATATVLAQYVQMGILLFFIAKRCRLVPEDWRELKFRRFLGAGGVLLGRTLASLFTMSLSTSMAARTGTASMAAHQICVQVWLAASLLSDSVALAGQTILARAFVQDDTELIDTVARRIMWLGLLMGGGMALVFLLGQYAIPLAFTHDPSVLAIIASLIPFIVLTQPINALAFVWDGLHYGASDFVYSAQVMVLAAVPAMAATFYLPQYFGIRGVWTGLAILMSVRALLGVGRYVTKSGPWEKLRESDV